MSTTKGINDIVCIALLLIMHTIITNPETAGTVNATGKHSLGTTWPLSETSPVNPLDAARFPGSTGSTQVTWTLGTVEVLTRFAGTTGTIDVRSLSAALE